MTWSLNFGQTQLRGSAASVKSTLNPGEKRVTQPDDSVRNVVVSEPVSLQPAQTTASCQRRSIRESQADDPAADYGNVRMSRLHRALLVVALPQRSMYAARP